MFYKAGIIGKSCHGKNLRIWQSNMYAMHTHILSWHSHSSVGLPGALNLDKSESGKTLVCVHVCSYLCMCAHVRASEQEVICSHSDTLRAQTEITALKFSSSSLSAFTSFFHLNSLFICAQPKTRLIWKKRKKKRHLSSFIFPGASRNCATFDFEIFVSRRHVVSGVVATEESDKRDGWEAGEGGGCWANVELSIPPLPPRASQWHFLMEIMGAGLLLLWFSAAEHSPLTGTLWFGAPTRVGSGVKALPCSRVIINAVQVTIEPFLTVNIVITASGRLHYQGDKHFCVTLTNTVINDL